MEQMRSLPENSIDAIVTDPPYGWRFMGKAWDAFDIEKMSQSVGRQNKVRHDGGRITENSFKAQAAGTYDTSKTGNQSFQQWTEAWAIEAFRVLKPGGHALVFCGPRTYHRMAAGVEDAGFEIRDQLQWLFGQGFPKSLNIEKQITDCPDQYRGFGTALKPANEPMVLARKPISEKTIADNVLRWGTGGLNIDGCRVGTSDNLNGGAYAKVGGREVSHSLVMGSGMNQPGKTTGKEFIQPQGRFPSNLIFSHEPECEDGRCSVFCAVATLDAQTGNLSKSASRFFYCAKTSKSERNNKSAVVNTHPTVKPIKLMEYLCRLITPPGGVILDPFMGSGSTGLAALNLGFEFLGIERDPAYFEVAKVRLGFDLRKSGADEV